MLDFYKYLGISPESTEEQIHNALLLVNEPLRSRAGAILLDAKKRSAYDHAHAAMKKIMLIRRDLQLVEGIAWTAENSREWSTYTQYHGTRARSASDEVNYQGSVVDNSSGTFRLGKAIGRRPLVLGIIVLIVIVLASLGYCNNSETPRTYSESNQELGTRGAERVESSKLTFNEPIEPTPEHGTVFVKRGNDESKLVLRNQNQTDLYFKLVVLNSTKVVRSFFLRKGEDCTIEVPFGEYELYMSGGQQWYGPSYGFGPNAYHTKFDAVLEFAGTSEGYTYQELTLYGVVDGNLRQSHVDQADFENLH
jgi:hypothetical protein